MTNAITFIFKDFPKLVTFLKYRDIHTLDGLERADLDTFLLLFSSSDNEKNTILRLFESAKIDLKHAQDVSDHITVQTPFEPDNSDDIHLTNEKKQSIPYITVLEKSVIVKKIEEEDTYYKPFRNVTYKTEDILSAINQMLFEGDAATVNEIYVHLQQILDRENLNKRKLTALITKYYGQKSFYTVKDVISMSSTHDAGNSKALFFALVKLIHRIGWDDSRRVMEGDMDVVRSHLFSVMGAPVHMDDSVADLRDHVSFFDHIETKIDMTQLEPTNLHFSIYKSFSQWSEHYDQTLKTIKRIPLSSQRYDFIPLVTLAFKEFLSLQGIATIADLADRYNRVTHHEVFPYRNEITALLKLFENPLIQTIREQTDRSLKQRFPSSLETMQYIASSRPPYAQGSNLATLHEIGTDLDLSRERVRQIHAKTIKDMSMMLNKPIFMGFRAIDVMKCLFEDFLSVTYDQVKVLFHEHSPLIFSGLEGLSPSVHIYPELSLINLDEFDWVQLIVESMEQLDSILDENDYSHEISRHQHLLAKRGIHISDDVIHALFESTYTQVGFYRTKKNLKKIDRYRIVMSTYFPDGLEKSNENHIKKFIDAYINLFSDHDIKKVSQRSILTRLTDTCVMIDKGRFQLIEKAPKLPIELYKKIAQDILESEEGTFLYDMLFERYRPDLERAGIFNRYAFQSQFKRFGKNTFHFNKDYIMKSQDQNDFYQQIDDYVNDLPCRFSLDLIKKRFRGISDTIISMWFYQSDHFVSLYGRSVMRRSCIESEASLKAKIEELIQKHLHDEKVVNARKLIPVIHRRFPRFKEVFNVSGSHDLLNIFSVWYGDWLYVKRPFISLEPFMSYDLQTLLNDYIKDKDRINIRDMRDYFESKGKKIDNFFDLIENLSNKYLRMDDLLLFSKDSIPITEDMIAEIEEVINRFASKTDVLDLSDDMVLRRMPVALIDWNQHSLASILNAYSDRFRIIYTTNNYMTTNYLAVKSESEVKTYDDYLSRTEY